MEKFKMLVINQASINHRVRLADKRRRQQTKQLEQEETLVTLFVCLFGLNFCLASELTG